MTERTYTIANLCGGDLRRFRMVRGSISNASVRHADAIGYGGPVFGGPAPSTLVTDATPSILCPACPRYVRGRRIVGTVSDHVCDHRCTSARGSDCECSCGGANHGIDHAPRQVTS